MAWEHYKGIWKNVVVESGGEVFPLQYTADILDGKTSTALANPYTAQITDHAGRNDGYFFDRIVAAAAGLGDVEFVSLLRANGTVWLYNTTYGKNLAIKIVNTSGTNLSFYTVYYGNESVYSYDSYSNNNQNYGALAILKNPDTSEVSYLWTDISFSLLNGVRDHGYYRGYAPRSQDTTMKLILSAIFAETDVPPGPTPSDEPYGDDTYTTSSGGDGGHDDTSDVISQDAIPIAAATRTGMCTAYVPDWGEIREVASALLDPNIFQILAQNVVKFSDVIIGLSVFPCTVPASYTGVVKGNVVGIEIGTGVVSHIADDQYVEINCGDLTVQEYWGNCLDYNPYTKISIFLPFCGTYELDADEIMGKTLNVSYRIDIMSGACLATIKIDGSVFYQYSGQCSAQIPLSSVSFDQFLSSMINLGVATATGVGAIGAAGAGVKEAETAFAATSGSASGGSALMEAREHLSSVKTQSANSIADATVGAVMGSKGFYTHAGAMSGSPGFLGVRTPYLIIKRPEQLIPGMYGKFHGFPCNTTAVLDDLVGYTEVGDIRLNIPDATVEEILECEQLLKGGVVI